MCENNIQLLLKYLSMIRIANSPDMKDIVKEEVSNYIYINIFLLYILFIFKYYIIYMVEHYWDLSVGYTCNILPQNILL